MAIDSAVNAASYAAELISKGTRPSTVWRFTVLSLLGAYEDRLARHGVATASRMFSAAPPRTGDDLIDQALASFAEYFAVRDQFSTPAWAEDPLLDTLPRAGKYARRGGATSAE